MYKWGIVADLVRALSNVSESNLDLNDTQKENALRDLADIMDSMITNKCSFTKAVKIEREAEEGFAEWIDGAVEKVKH